MSFSPANPGWYPDPETPGQQRYWDGAQWTGEPMPVAAPRATSDPRQWAMIAHLSALAGLFIGFNFLGPLIVYLIKKDEDPFVRDQAVEALNFNLSVFIYLTVLGIATFILILVVVGVLLIPVLAAAVIAWVVFVIIAATRANNGEAYRYPLTIRFVT
jgi:uncharacterized Tic20 family protein